MSAWNLSTLLANLHGDIQGRLDIARNSFGHMTAKGDASEGVWLELLQKYLPKRYQAETAHVVDSDGKFSDQIDVVVFDRQYSPFIFDFQGQKVVPAESVYAVFEAKQTVNASLIAYAQDKVASVRALHRTSLPIPHAGGTFPAKKLFPILGASSLSRANGPQPSVHHCCARSQIRPIREDWIWAASPPTATSTFRMATINVSRRASPQPPSCSS